MAWIMAKDQKQEISWFENPEWTEALRWTGASARCFQVKYRKYRRTNLIDSDKRFSSTACVIS